MLASKVVPVRGRIKGASGGLWVVAVVKQGEYSTERTEGGKGVCATKKKVGGIHFVCVSLSALLSFIT